MTDLAFRTSAPFTAPAVWSGRILSGAIGGFLAMEGLSRLFAGRALVASSGAVSAMDGGTQTALGAGLLAGAALLALRRTRLVGTTLLILCVGGLLAVESRTSTPSVSHILFWAYVGVLVAAGFALRRAPSR